MRWRSLVVALGIGCGGAPEPVAPAPEPAPVAAAAEEAPPAGKIGGEPILPDPVVIGGISRERVDAGVDAQRAAIVGCWEEARKEKPALAGKVLVKFTIAKDGSVKTTAIKSTSLRHEGAETCLAGKLAAARFDPLASGELAIVHYPFVFPPAG